MRYIILSYNVAQKIWKAKLYFTISTEKNVQER